MAEPARMPVRPEIPVLPHFAAPPREVSRMEWRDLTDKLVAAHGEREGLRGRWYTDAGESLKQHIIVAILSLQQQVLSGEATDGVFFDYPDAVFKTPIYNLYDLQGISFKNADFAPFADGKHIKFLIFKETDFSFSTFEWLIIGEARFEQCNFFNAALTASTIDNCRFQHCRLANTRFTEMDMLNARFESSIANFSTAFDRIIGREQRKDFFKAASQYLRIRTLYKENALHDLAGYYYYREKHCSRKAAYQKLRAQWRTLSWQEIRSLWFNDVMFPYLYEVLCAYGERPSRTFVAGAAVVVFFACFYLFAGIEGIADYDFPLRKNGSEAFSFSELCYDWILCLVLSAGSFTTVNFESWYPPTLLGKAGMALESLIGVVLTSLYLIALSRKMIRD